MQENSAQHRWYSVILAANTASNTDKLTKMGTYSFFAHQSESVK